MDSFRLAPEWARQDAVILVWPHSNSDWNNQLKAIEHTYIELSRYISRNQKLLLVAYDSSHTFQIQEALELNNITQENIQFTNIPTNDTWVRDYGPVIVQSESESVLLDFKFDAWGKKYHYEHDNQFNKNFKQQLNIQSRFKEIDTVLEAGNLEINAKGILLSSSTCFNRISSQSNVDLSQLEKFYENWFGCHNVCWMNNTVLKGDDTDGHIDTLVRFCSDDILVYSAPTNHSHSDNDVLHSLISQLEVLKHNEASLSELIPLPVPKPIFNADQQLPATYTNFLITNQYVLVPVFNDPQDNYALKTLDELFPTREIIEIESNTLIKQYGGIHCAAMQVPEGFLS
ncbi:MAG: agmatine deiminase family protein [Gammaproteobacteria bacterium]